MTNEISTQNEQTVTTKELATMLGVTIETVRVTAKKVIDPSKVLWRVINGGKSQVFTEEQATSVKQEIQKHHNLSSRQIDTVTTELEENQMIENVLMILHRRNDELRLRAEKAEQQLIEQKPKVDVYNRIADGRGCFTVNQAAKALKLPYGNKTLFKKLKELGILNQDNSPSQTQTNSGNFKVIVKFINDDVGNKNVTLITSKGLVYLAKKFNTTIDESVKADA
jgi:phage antirepressor YoqD-like protein